MPSADASAGAVRPCPVCAAGDADVLHQRRFVLAEGHPLSAGYSVLICRVCGMAYASPIPEQEAYDRWYRESSKYSHASSGTGTGAQPWDDRRLADTASLLLPFLPALGTHVVDLGCGGGGLLRHLAARGCTSLTGIDPAEACATMTDAIPGVRGVVGGLFSPAQDVAPADLLLLSHVLEHVRDTRRAVEALRPLMARQGRVWVECPDATRYTEYLVAPFLDFNTEHINHFSERTLRRLFTEQGWTVIASGQRAIPSSPTRYYPCVWILAEMCAGGSATDATHARPADEGTTTPAQVHDLRDALTEYVRVSRAMMDRVSASCERLGLQEREIAVWGTGQTTSILLADTTLGQAHIRYFTDSNPLYHGSRIGGVPVVAPDALRADPTLPIVIGSLLHADEITASVAQLGLTNPVLRLSAD